jgi:N-hydroxyarylamine O-acetyltransferase
MMDTEAYLERINYNGPLVPTAQSLRELQMAHLLAVPFENLSIHWEEPIVLADDALFEKVVERRRGGFCFELNGLFAALLRDLGFEVVMLSARVARGEGSYTSEFDHMTLMVSLAERWLVDVGFGDTFREPLRLDDRSVQVQNGRDYLIAPDDDYLILSERQHGDEWQAQYRFNLQPYQYPDYVERCHYHQTSPESHFRQRRICTRATPKGRLTLSELRFITTTLSGERQERLLPNEEEYGKMLAKHFGITRK